MKKTVTLPDGTVEVLEGTAEEIAEHERLIRENQKRPSQPKPPILKGKEPDQEMWKRLEEWVEQLQKATPPSQPWYPNGPIWIVPCSMCGHAQCTCHMLDLTPKIICSLGTDLRG